MHRLATHYPDGVVAGILNRQGRKTAYGHRFQAHHVANLRQRWKIPNERKAESSDGELLTIKKAAAALGVAPSTLHRLLNDGIIGGSNSRLARPGAYD